MGTQIRRFEEVRTAAVARLGVAQGLARGVAVSVLRGGGGRDITPDSFGYKLYINKFYFGILKVPSGQMGSA
jgi:hypothetical protein